jgi:hypothetical protein
LFWNIKQKLMKAIYVASLIMLFLSCNTNSGNNKNSEDSVVYATGKVSETRSNINPTPVKTYSETVKSFETTDEFKVSLFETKQTFHYLIKINYKNLEAEDTLNVPNFGEVPSVEIMKGDKHPSCIVGFLDNNKQFRESKLIFFENNKIKVHVLKHYGVFVK